MCVAKRGLPVFARLGLRWRVVLLRRAGEAHAAAAEAWLPPAVLALHKQLTHLAHFCLVRKLFFQVLVLIFGSRGAQRFVLVQAIDQFARTLLRAKKIFQAIFTYKIGMIGLIYTLFIVRPAQRRVPRAKRGKTRLLAKQVLGVDIVLLQAHVRANHVLGKRLQARIDVARTRRFVGALEAESAVQLGRRLPLRPRISVGVKRLQNARRPVGVPHARLRARAVLARRKFTLAPLVAGHVLQKRRVRQGRPGRPALLRPPRQEPRVPREIGHVLQRHPHICHLTLLHARERESKLVPVHRLNQLPDLNRGFVVHRGLAQMRFNCAQDIVFVLRAPSLKVKLDVLRVVQRRAQVESLKARPLIEGGQRGKGLLEAVKVVFARVNNHAVPKLHPVRQLAGIAKKGRIAEIQRDHQEMWVCCRISARDMHVNVRHPLLGTFFVSTVGHAEGLLLEQMLKLPRHGLSPLTVPKQVHNVPAHALDLPVQVLFVVRLAGQVAMFLRFHAVESAPKTGMVLQSAFVETRFLGLILCARAAGHQRGLALVFRNRQQRLFVAVCRAKVARLGCLFHVQRARGLSGAVAAAFILTLGVGVVGELDFVRADRGVGVGVVSVIEHAIAVVGRIALIQNRGVRGVDFL